MDFPIPAQSVMRLLAFAVFLIISLSSATLQPPKARFSLTAGCREKAELQLRAGSGSVIDHNSITKAPATVDDRVTPRPLEAMTKRLVVGTLFLAWYMTKYVASHFRIIVTHSHYII